MKSHGAPDGSEPLQRLARVEARVRWLADHWEQIGIEACLDHLAEARSDLSGAGAALVRDAFVDAVRRADTAEVCRTAELLYRLPGPPDGSP